MNIKPYILFVSIITAVPCVSIAEQSERFAAHNKASSERFAAHNKASSERCAAHNKASSERCAAHNKANAEACAASQKANAEACVASQKAQLVRNAAGQMAVSVKMATWIKAWSEKTFAWFKAGEDYMKEYMNMNVTDPLQPRNIAPDALTQAISQGVTSSIPGAGEIFDLSNAWADLIKPFTQINADTWNNKFATSDDEGLYGHPFIPPNWASTHTPQMIALDKELKQLQKRLGDDKSLNPMDQRISPDNLGEYKKIIERYTQK